MNSYLRQTPRTNATPALRAMRHAAIAAGLAVGLLGGAAQAQTPTLAAPAAAAADTLSSATVVAKVNGEPVTAGERDAMADRMIYQQLQRLGPAVANIPQEQLSQFRAQVKPQALQQVINRDLVMQAKKKANIEIPQAEIDKQKDQMKATLKERGLTYEEYLSRAGKTDAEVDQALRDELQIEKLLTDRTGSSLEPTDAQMQAFYDQNKDKMSQPATVRASHILIKFPGDPRSPDFKAPDDATKAQLKKKAEDVLAKIKAGGDFAELAKEYSEDPGSKVDGGDLGYHEKGAMVKAFDDQLWSMDVGDVSPVIESEFGYHIIKMTGKKPGGVPDFKEVKPAIHDELVNQRFSDAMDNLLEDLRKNAKIEILEKETTGTTKMPILNAPSSN